MNANARSIISKLDDLQCTCDYNLVDIAVITETWLNNNSSVDPISMTGYHTPLATLVLAGKEDVKLEIILKLDTNLSQSSPITYHAVRLL
jgi:hypothetical protein